MEETTVWKGCSSQALNFTTYLFCALAGVILLAAISLLQTSSSTPSFFSWLLALFLLAPAGIALRAWLRIRFRVYELTSERFLVTHGIFSKQTDTLELYRVKDLTLLQPFFLRLFSLGNIVLQTSDRTTPTFIIEAVANPKDFSDLVRKHVELCRVSKRVGEVDMNESVEN